MRVEGLGFRVQGLGLRVEGLGFRVEGLGFNTWGFKFAASVLGVLGLGLRDSAYVRVPQGLAPPKYPR